MTAHPEPQTPSGLDQNRNANPVFRHKFGGWDEQDARRHVNPDGSLGAIVALTAEVASGLHLDASIEIGDSARIGARAHIGYDAIIGARATITPRAYIGDGACIGDDDWFTSCGPIGSRKEMLTAVQTADGLRWWVGCKHGITTENLRELVAKTHGGTNHEADYLHIIDCIERNPARLRNEAARDRGETKDAGWA